MSLASTVGNIFFNITRREPLAVYNNSPRTLRTGRVTNRTIKLRDVEVTDEELRKLDSALRFAYPDRFIRVRRMTAKAAGADYKSETIDEPKVVVTFSH